jgi:glycosyltransferase involved in cell wall biosynthesis
MIEQARALGIAAGRVPLGIALDRWPPVPPRRRVPGEPARLLHIGSLNLVKDQGTLLRAAHALREAGVRFRLDVVGGDTLGGAVQRRSAEMGLDDVVHFHPFVPHHELRARVDGADLLVITSRHEGGSEVFLEAAAAGIPAAGTAVGYLAEWAPDGAAAVPVGDHAALAREIARLLSDEDARMRMAARAQERALAEDADFTAREILRHYAELVEGAGRSG